MKSAGFFVSSVLISLLICGCESPREEPAFIASQEAVLISEGQTSSKLTQTASPVPSPTATKAPEPDAKALINWRDLHLPPDYVAKSPNDYGIGIGASSWNITLNDGTVKQFPIESSFVFSNDDMPRIYGFTTMLTSYREIFDNGYLPSLDILIARALGVPEGSESDVVVRLPDVKGFGDTSAAIKGEYSFNGKTWDLYEAAYRLGDIGVFVLIRNESDSAPAIDLKKLAEVYAESITNPPEKCHFVSIESVGNDALPSFDFIAEGFYPGEWRQVSLKGNFKIGDKVETMQNVLVGSRGQGKADMEGIIQGNINSLTLPGDNVVYPDEYQLEIEGWFSNCLVSQIVTTSSK